MQSKIGVRIIHRRALYTGKYGSCHSRIRSMCSVVEKESPGQRFGVRNREVSAYWRFPFVEVQLNQFKQLQWVLFFCLILCASVVKA